MVGGRPPKGDHQRHPELEELADWFGQAIEEAGYSSLNAVVRAEVAHKNVVYDISNAARLCRLEQVRSFSVGLGRDPTEVESVWIRAKEAMDRAADAEREAKAPQLASWAQLPQPSLSLKTLLEAQARAVERLPYDMLGVEEPPLSAVYVRQQVRTPRDISPETTERRGGEPPSEPDHTTEPLRAEARLPVQDALARHEHLLITGEPGAGKSTLTSHLAWTLARVWLHQETSVGAPIEEPVLPVRVAAHSLVGESDSWSAALNRAVRRSMGLSLVADPAPWLFQGRAQGARWLVLLDGLDEITDHDARRNVIKAIAQYARADSDYRFVITSRPLPEAELSPLRTASLGEYALEPFGPEELREFAARWFAAQFADDDKRARAATDRFLKETEDSRLRELVRNPLLATIAAVNATVSPSRPLPTNRVSLYQSFFARLLAQGTSSDRTGRAALRRHLTNDPDRLELHLWLDRNKRTVLRVLGRHRLEHEGSLLDAAADWVREQARTLTDRVPDWQEDLPDYLRGTGLLVTKDDGFRFLHHSFAEYFAAEAYAAEIPTDFPDPESWFWRAAHHEDQTLPVFVLCLWANQPGCGPDLLAERLMSGAAGGHRRPLLGGLLLAEGVRFGDAYARQVVDRLVLIACCCDWNREYQAEAFTLLGGLGHVPPVAERLEAIGRSVRLSIEARLLAVQAFSRFGPADIAEELLGEALGGVHGWLDKAADVACTLGPGAKQAVRQRALEVVADSRWTPWMAGVAVEALAQLGLPDDVAEHAAAQLADPSVRSTTVRKVSEAWLTAAPESTHHVAESIKTLILRRPVHDTLSQYAAGEVLEKFGEIQAAAEIARHLLSSDQVWADPLEWAATTLIKVEGEKALPTITRALERSTPDAGQYPWIPARLHAALAELGGGDEAAAWSREMLERHSWSIGYAEDAAATWLKAEGVSAVDSVLEHTGRGRRVLSHHRAALAEALFDVGARSEADEVAELALRTPYAVNKPYEVAARLLIKVRGFVAVEQFLDIWKATPALALNANWLQGVTKALPECEENWYRVLPVISELARSLVTLPYADGEAITSGLRLLLSVEGADAVPFAVSTATGRSWLTWDQIREIARQCATLGQRDAALTLWRHVLEASRSVTGHDFTLLMDMEAAGATAEAAAWIKELLSERNLHSARLFRLRQLLAWLEEGDRSTLTAPHTST